MSTKQFTVALVAAVLAGSALLTGCGSNDSDAAPVASIGTPGPADLQLAAGSAGPVKVGMTKAQAAATRVFDTDVADPTDGCPVHALLWKKQYGDALDVQALKNGEVASIGVRKAGPKTADGLQVGSSYADVLASNPGARVVAAGYGQAGVLVHDTANDGWIGYLFDAKPAKVAKTTKVSFIEITRGEKPSLMRDGC